MTRVPHTPRFDRRQAMATGLAGLAGTLLCPKSLAKAAETLTFFRIGTGPTAETLYGLGTAISAGISRPPGSSPCDEGGICGVPGLIAVAQTRTGSIQSIRDMRDGTLESALVHADIAYWAYTQAGPFVDEAGIPDLRTIANLIPVTLHIVVRADSGIETLRNLKDKVISLGTRGSGTPRFVDVLLRTKGIKPEDIHPVFLRPGAAADRLISGEIDVFFLMGAAPIDAVVELVEDTRIRILPIDNHTVTTLQGFFPFLSRGVIAEDAYADVDEVPSLQLGVQWVVREKTESSLVEAITRALWQSETAELFNLNNPGHAFPSLEDGQPNGFVPPHPGAQLYYDRALSSG